MELSSMLTATLAQAEYLAKSAKISSDLQIQARM